MIIDDYLGSFDERMMRLNTILDEKDNIVLVGSSYGGLMASVFTCLNEGRMKKLVLLAPALSLDEFRPYLDKKIHIPVIVYHGEHDDVVPVEPVNDIALKVFTNLKYHIIDDDHSLHKNFDALDWDTLLSLRSLKT